MEGKFRDYALLRFVCPKGHALGRAHMDHSGAWVLEAGTSVFWAGAKVRARCPKCLSAGLPAADLQGSEAKIRQRLAELREDPNRGTDTYQLGG